MSQTNVGIAIMLDYTYLKLNSGWTVQDGDYTLLPALPVVAEELLMLLVWNFPNFPVNAHLEILLQINVWTDSTSFCEVLFLTMQHFNPIALWLQTLLFIHLMSFPVFSVTCILFYWLLTMSRHNKEIRLQIRSL